MTSDPTAAGQTCPICGSAGEALLHLSGQPIYQHPVPADAVVPEPHLIELSWNSCVNCAHAWQPNFDAAVLREIYRNYYYTPAPDGIGVQFRDEFLAILKTLGIGATPRVLLEIGASDGDVLAALKKLSGASRAYAFEPNRENASIARQRGLDVREKFFGGEVAEDGLEPVDLVYSRHVIEHVFDFDGFFAGLNAVTTPMADLVLETPSLDHHVAHGSIAPFHIEHVHVFALRSLVWLARRHGWGFKHSAVTSSGNLIAAFSRGARPAEIPAPHLQGLQAAVAQRRAHLQKLLAGRHMIFWGAGSAGIVLAKTIDREPDIWTDGNPNKIGKRFVGSTRHIVSPEVAIAQDHGDMILVVTSSFVAEILPRIQQCGWRGDVYDMEGKRLLARHEQA